MLIYPRVSTYLRLSAAEEWRLHLHSLPEGFLYVFLTEKCMLANASTILTEKCFGFYLQRSSLAE